MLTDVKYEDTTKQSIQSSTSCTLYKNAYVKLLRIYMHCTTNIKLLMVKVYGLSVNEIY